MLDARTLDDLPALADCMRGDWPGYPPDEPLMITFPSTPRTARYVALWTDGEGDDDRPLHPGWYVFEGEGRRWLWRDAIDRCSDITEVLDLVDWLQTEDRKEHRCVL